MLSPITAEFVASLQSAHGQDVLRPDAAPYLREPRGRDQGQGVVLAPRDTAAVAAIVRACAVAQVGIVPYGGGTGLVGGQVMTEGPAPLILSLERMTTIRRLCAKDGAMIVEAGATLQSAQDAAATVGRLFPLSLASQGTATIGGNLATNAGGTAVLRYGNARDLCLGLEAVLPDGSIWHGLKSLRKDNTGYDLRNLLIGAEGTLGVITAASLRLFTPPAHRVVALLAVPSPQAAQALLALYETRIAGLITAFELIGRSGFDFLAEVGPAVRLPFATAPEWSVLMELGLPAMMEPEATMAALYDDGATAGLVLDGVIATSTAQAQQLWAIREAIPEANRRIGSVSSHDISLPLSAIPGFLQQAGAALAKVADFRINAFGHLGDGNLHYNVFPARGRDRADYAAQRETVKHLVHDLVDKLGGSVSAEHGIGRLKVDDLVRYGDPGKLVAMRKVKAALDPKGIMNPGAIFRR